jgi:proteasome lid subunit RPN8/RPN11
MIRIEKEAWEAMLAHARQAYPKECCGIMLGFDGDPRHVRLAIPCSNAYEGEQKDRFLIDARDQMLADRRARELGMDVLGFFHSHPDCDAYFSATDLKYSWPWYSNVVMSIQNGDFHHARSFIANTEQTGNQEEELIHPR